MPINERAIKEMLIQASQDRAEYKLYLKLKKKFSKRKR